jgi:hypothetical protein
MNDRDYVIRACQMKKLDLIKPKRGLPGVIVYDFNVKPVAPCVVDAANWKVAREQINAYFMKEAAK